MLMGMGFVFVFLSLLVALISLMSQMLKLPHDSAVPETVVTEPEPGPGDDLMSDPELVSVITSAIQDYRKQQQKSNRG